MYSQTNSLDGNARLDITVKHRVTLDDLAVYITAQLTTDLSINTDAYEIAPNRPAIRKAVPTKRAAIKIAQDCLYQDGPETPHYRVGDGGLDDIRAAVLDHLNTLWN